jgi:hypothetical protein
VGLSKPAGNIESDAVVVVVIEPVGAEFMFESGSLAQPARRPMAPQNAKIGVSRLAARTKVE